MQSSAGETALHLATLNGHFSVVEFLLLEKADLNLANSSGTTGSYHSLSLSCLSSTVCHKCLFGSHSRSGG
jgi:ankyrin repeat protein